MTTTKKVEQEEAADIRDSLDTYPSTLNLPPLKQEVNIFIVLNQNGTANISRAVVASSGEQIPSSLINNLISINTLSSALFITDNRDIIITLKQYESYIIDSLGITIYNPSPTLKCIIQNTQDKEVRVRVMTVPPSSSSSSSKTFPIQIVGKQSTTTIYPPSL